MGQAVKKSDQIATDRRPSKVLRQRNIQLVNLGTYTQNDTSRIPVLRAKKPNTKSIAPQRTHSEYVKLESQPFDTKAATNDTAFGQSRSESKQQHTPPKNPLTVIILGSLCFGSLVGYQWSSLHNLAPLAGNKVESDLGIDSVATAEPTAAVATLAEPVAPQTQALALTQAQTDAAIEREQQYRLEEKEFLSQIDWLNNQNSNLINELDTLKIETLNQNRELLAMELEVVALQSQSEPSTETRVIYNFVNTPIGSSTPVQFGGSNTPYNEDVVEDSDESIAYKLEQQRSQYNDEGQRVYDLETGEYIETSNESFVGSNSQGNFEELNNEDSPNELDSYETVNSELLNELQQVRLRQFEAGLLDYDHATGTFVQKDFGNANSDRISYPPIATE